MVRFASIVGGCILLAVLYGIIHDQITIRICHEYFSVWHPHVVDSDDPTMLALVWGVIATWWVGAILGILFWAVATLGPRPMVPINTIIKWVCLVLVIAGAAATVTGLIVAALQIELPSFMSGPLADRPAEFQHRLSTVFAIHNASYGAAFCASIAVAAIILMRRHR